MKTITRFMYTLHRILGTLLSVLFLVWFLSAFVMMYHGFPRAGEAEKQAKQELLSLSDSLPPIDEVMARIPSGQKVNAVTIDRFLGQTVFRVRTPEQTYELPAHATDTLPAASGKRIAQIAALWCKAPVARIDTLTQLDQWIPFGKLREEFPIYKFHFDDAKKHELYIGSQSGEVLQFTNREERFWAWLGAIPHWVYFTWLRQDASLWSLTVSWLSGIGCLMVIAGMWIGIHNWRIARKGRGRFSPYRKRWYHWHYTTGIIFGLFVLTFTFSGMMSLVEVPGWISQATLKVKPLREIRKGGASPTDYPLDYRRVIAAYPNALQLEWNNFRSVPYYTVKEKKNEFFIDASDTLPRALRLSKEQIVAGVKAIHGDSTTLQVSLLNRFETDYRDMSRMYSNRSLLPVWKITVADADGSCYYIHPETGIVKYVNTPARWKYWMYTALHRMRIGVLNSDATLRKSVLWVLLLGGTVCSLSGVILGIRYLRRKARF
ncbi:PepSY-associated TM helix domain-containing protein [Bacteroides neonati]|uniref:PepSY-associated TM helix domain-containing protein n=1 Tax=Bacteroides neonati TaxID=1347393 RepID=UPI0005AAB02A|nr:PepSY-associated TM helix domain-containing protein [Bacteroides neonati]